MTLWHRFARFNVVGTVGVGVQLGTLALLTDGLGHGYLPATVVAVVSAIAHNFGWHVVWTWSDRRGGPSLANRFARFVVANGAVSLVGNVILMAALVGGAGLEPIPANVVAIAICGLVNFWLGDRWVFGPLPAVPAPTSRARPGNDPAATGYFPSGRNARLSGGSIMHRSLTVMLALGLTLVGLPVVAAEAGRPDARQTAPAQATGRIAGVVRDPAGQPVADQAVLLRRPGRRGVLSDTTDGAGAFVFMGLEPGRYEVVVTVADRTVTKGVGLLPEAMTASEVVLVVFPPATAGAGQKIRVFFRNGQQQRARLVTLTQTELVAWTGNDSLTIQLSEVDRIERVTHYLRDGTLAGLAVGAGAGLILDWALRDQGEAPPAGTFAMALAGIGTGVGAAVGAAMGLRADRLIWPTPGSTTVVILPVLSPSRTGAYLSIRW